MLERVQGPVFQECCGPSPRRLHQFGEDVTSRLESLTLGGGVRQPPKHDTMCREIMGKRVSVFSQQGRSHLENSIKSFAAFLRSTQVLDELENRGAAVQICQRESLNLNLGYC
eukprot:CAMPEP_0114540850 /NCGR_PEP_ID=MMETSP0114-20121206/992_1 /TAXON_ID=31324 /ORGANISM="Goniomonas sp, Strain m" /LENGTH=112 /DNA_ID=CAMNT_0001725049 /DNA_START=979 /DNA_END=1317 /DNA_ORIENTATION=-